MAQVCLNCGASSPEEARFCRLCGTPLRRTTSNTGEANISPIAQTVPLKNEGRSTEGFPPDDPRKTSADTTRVAHSEMERLLKGEQQERSESPEYIFIPTAHSATDSSPLTTSRLAAPTVSSQEESVASAQQVAPPSTAARNSTRARRRWPIALFALLLVALTFGALIYALTRNRASSESKSSADNSAEVKTDAGEVAQVNGAESDGAQQQQSATQPQTERPGPSIEPTVSEHSARNHPSEDEAASNANAVARAATAAQPASSEQPRANQPAASVVTDHYRRGLEMWEHNRQSAVEEFRIAAQSNPDAYYYLGLNLAEGRDPHKLQRAELVAALQYFQLAQRGAHRAEAAQYAERLGREYDRRRNKGSSQ